MIILKTFVLNITFKYFGILFLFCLVLQIIERFNNIGEPNESPFFGRWGG